MKIDELIKNYTSKDTAALFLITGLIGTAYDNRLLFWLSIVSWSTLEILHHED